MTLPPRAADQDSALLTTKLYIPPSRSNLVPRSRLIQRLDEGLASGRKLTLISAPAGFGKTTLLSEWAENSKPSVAWLSLEEGDNDPTRFLAYFIAALQTIEEDIGETALAMLHSPQPPPVESVLTSLINEIATIPDRIVLVLDDYHLIEAQPIHDALTFLLDHLPVTMHLVITTRSDPPLHLARLMGRGQLTELRSSDLRFTSDETAEFLNRVMDLALSEEDVATLVFRTEGWITGLQMAAISMQGLDAERIADFIRAFTGSNRYVLAYLVEEVLDQQPQGTQDFLLQTSVLNRLSGPLCEAVTGQSNGQHILEQLEQDNLFVVTLDDERYWYRYHHLFADLLRSQLSRLQPDLLPTLHRRAGEWFEQAGLIPEAVHHAVTARDFDRAATLVESLASSLLNESRPATLLSLMAKLPDEAVVARPSLCVHGAWAHFLTWQFDAVEPLLQAAESRLSEIAEAQLTETFAGYTRIRGRMITLRAFMAQWQGDLPGAIELSHEALKHLDKDDQQLRSVLETNLGDICVIRGELASARQHLEKSITAGEAAGNFYAALSSVSRLAELEAIQGHLHQAAKTYRQAIQLGIEWGGGKPMPGTGRAHVGLAQVLYEWNDLDGTARHLTPGIHLGEQCGEQEIVLQGYLTLARLRQAQGKPDAATEALERAEAIAPRDNRILPASHVSNWQARISLAQGDLTAASHWADSQESELDVPDVSDFRFEEPCLTLVRVRIAQGKVEDAMELLERLLLTAESGGRLGSVIEMLILSALALQAQSHEAQSMTSLAQALSLAESEGYVRVFVDEGKPMVRLLRQAASRGIAPGYVSKLLAACDVSDHKADPRTQPLIEPLSQRELEVLRLLTTGFSTPEIARELFIAVSTVRSHVKSIYSKLNVHKRKDAIQRAKELKLL